MNASSFTVNQIVGILRLFITYEHDLFRTRCLVTQRPPLRYYRWDSLTQPMLITILRLPGAL